MPSNSKSVAKDQEKEAMVHNTLRSLCLKQGNQDQLAWVTCDAVITPRLNSLLTLRKKNVCCNRSRNFLFQKGSCQKRSEHLLTSPSKTSRRKYTALDQKERNSEEVQYAPTFLVHWFDLFCCEAASLSTIALLRSSWVLTDHSLEIRVLAFAWLFHGLMSSLPLSSWSDRAFWWWNFPNFQSYSHIGQAQAALNLKSQCIQFIQSSVVSFVSFSIHWVQAEQVGVSCNKLASSWMASKVLIKIGRVLRLISLDRC